MKFNITLVLFLIFQGSGLAQTVTNFLTDFSFAFGLALKGDDLYVSDRTAGTIVKADITASNPVKIPVATINADPSAMAFLGNDLYVRTNNSIQKIDTNSPSSSPQTILSNVASGTTIAIIGNELFYGEINSGQVRKINLSDANPVPETVLSGFNSINGLAKIGNRLYVCEANSISYIDLNVTTLSRTLLASVSGLPFGLSQNGNFLYTSVAAGIARIDVTAANPMATLVPNIACNDPYGILLHNGIMYVADDSRVKKIAGLAVSFSLNNKVCSNIPTTILGGASPSGGVYSGAGVTDNGNGETFTLNVSILPIGMSTVTYTLGSQVITAQVEIVGTPTLNISSQTNIACNGQANGAITVNVTGGSTPYAYLWSNNAMTPTVTNIPVGTYTVTATDNNGCSSNVGSATVTQPTSLASSTTNTPNTGTMNGTATVIPLGGTAPYTYLWSNNATTSSISGLSEGNYSVTVTDANGCTNMNSTMVTLQNVPGNLCATPNSINPLFGQAIGAPQTSSIWDNTLAGSINDPSTGFECFDDAALNHTLWFSFTGDGGKYAIKTTQCTVSAADYLVNGDSQLAIYTGDCANPTAVACNEDENFNSNLFNAYIEVQTTQGVNYSMMMDGWSGTEYTAVGAFCIEVTRLQTTQVVDVNDTDIVVSPNPTSGIVQWKNVNATYIALYDNLGKRIIEQKNPASQLDVSALPSGIYTLQLHEGDKVFVTKVVKQ